jgi:hypothetical protein
MPDMTKRLAGVILGASVLILAGGVALSVPAVASGGAVPDAAFRACLNEYLGAKADADISQAQLEGLKGKPDGVIECTPGTTKIASLEGAQHLKNITLLNLRGHAVSDLTPLAGLTGLQALDVSSNKISDVTPLAGLTKLVALDIRSNQITRLGGLPATFLPYAQLSRKVTVGGWREATTTEVAEGGHVLAVAQTAAWTVTPGTYAYPVSDLAFADGACAGAWCFQHQAVTWTVAAGKATLDNAKATVTFAEAGTVTLKWAATAKATYSAWSADWKASQAPYFSGTVTVTVKAAATPTPTPTPTATPTPTKAASVAAAGAASPAASSATTTPAASATPAAVAPTTTPAAAVAPDQCGVKGAVPLAGPAGQFLDVLADQPHLAEINWLQTSGWSQGWTVSCYTTDGDASYVIRSGSGWSLAPGRYDSTHGVLTDVSFGVNAGTIGQIFQPLAAVARADAAVWLAQLALDDQGVDLASADGVADFLDGDYALTLDTWTKGPDGEWGTGDEPKVVTIPAGHKYYAQFADVTPGAAGDRQGHAVTFLANTVVNARFDDHGNLVGGQRLAEGFPGTDGTAAVWGSGDLWTLGEVSARDFRPLASIARQDMAAFLYRIALYEVQSGEHPTVDLSVSTPIGGWSDHGEAVYWLRGANITEGFADGTFGGLFAVVRQDLAAFLKRAAGFIGA